MLIGSHMDKPHESAWFLGLDSATWTPFTYVSCLVLSARATLLALFLVAPIYARDVTPSNVNATVASSPESTSVNASPAKGVLSNKPAMIDLDTGNGWDAVSLWNAIVQTLTLTVVLFYTILTRRMQRVMARQIKLSVMPAFVLSLVQTNMRDVTLGATTFVLQITNIGSGTALNIEVGKVLLQSLNEGRRKIGEPNLQFDALGLLRHDETSPLRHHSYSAGQQVEEDFMIDFEEQITKPCGFGISLVITFQDIEGDRYQQQVRLSRTGCSPSAVRAL